MVVRQPSSVSLALYTMTELPDASSLKRYDRNFLEIDNLTSVED